MNPESLPHAEEAERAVLACCLLRPEDISIAAGHLDERHFYTNRHKIIWRAMWDIWVEHAEGARGIDLRTLQAEIERAGKFEEVGGLAYLAGLDLDLPDLGGLERYATIILDRWRRRQLIEMGSRLAAAAQNGTDVSETIGRAGAELLDLETDARSFEYVHAADGFEDLRLDRGPEERVGISTGIHALDEEIIGLLPGHLYVIGGITGHGKTSLALGMLRAAALAGHPCAMVSLEMSRAQITGRLLSQVTGIPHRSIQTAQLSADQRQRIDAARNTLMNMPLWVDYTPIQTIDAIIARARRLKAEREIQVLAIDYLSLIETSDPKENQEIRISRIARRCKLAAKELDVAVVLLHQLANEGQKADRPLLVHLKYSGAVGQDADVVLMTFITSVVDESEDPGVAEIIIRKNRDGVPAGTCHVGWIGELMRFADVARQPEPRQ